MNKRKHELEQNELADKLGEQIEKIKPHLPLIGLIMVVIVIAGMGGYWWINRGQEQAAAEWRDFFYYSNEAEKGDDRALQTVAELYPDTNAGTLALLQAGDRSYAMGSRSLGKDKTLYVNQLTAAADFYEQVVESEGKVDPFIKRRATFALAHTYEALGKFDDALRYYQMIVDQAGDSELAEFAETGIVRISNTDNQAIFTAFQTWEPTTTAPGIGPILPRRPDISFPQPVVDPNQGGGDFEADPPPVPDDEKKAGDETTGENAGDKSDDESDGSGEGNTSDDGSEDDSNDDQTDDQ